MGQIFNAAVCDIENNVCYSKCVDKFHANCYSFSTVICSTHLRLHITLCGSEVTLSWMMLYRSYETINRILVWRYLLQIVDNCPEDYKKISYCFASIRKRCRYCKKVFGLDNERFILKNKKGERLEMVTLSLFLKRSDATYIQYEKTEDRAYYNPVIEIL